VDDKCEFAYETLGTVEVQRGNLSKAVELFNKAIPLANTELEMGHLFGLRDAAMAQTTVSSKLGITLPGMMG
jgi:import receptor subunit TOM70